MATTTIDEDYSWEINYDAEGKPLYYNRFSQRVLLCRPKCLASSGRVSIKQPLVEAYYNGLWFKGTLLEPTDRVRFAVRLENGPVQLLYADRDRIRKWPSVGRQTVPLFAQRVSRESITDTSDSKLDFLVSDDEESLSKLSDTLSTNNSTDEKCDLETLQERQKQLKSSKAGNTEKELQSRTRPKSWRCPKTQRLCYEEGSDQELDINWMDKMLPLRANPSGEGTGRRQRINAVMLDLNDLKAINDQM